jgi:hypothetical protein
MCKKLYEMTFDEPEARILLRIFEKCKATVGRYSDETTREELRLIEEVISKILRR